MSNLLVCEESSLPPNVSGKSRGYLELEIVKLDWFSKGIDISKPIPKRSSTERNPSSLSVGTSAGISTKFVWWGENFHNSKVIKLLGNKKTIKANRIRYSIQTSRKLFHEYLANCEPIEIKISSIATNLQIGTVFARVPAGIVKNCLNCDRKPTEQTIKYRIFSPKNTILGELSLKFRMVLCESEWSTHIDSDGTIDHLKDELKLDLDDLYCNNEKTDNVDRIRVCLAQFLNGERTALRELERTSPTFVHDFALNGLESTKKWDDYNKIDLMRLHVYSLTLLPPGIRDVNVLSLANTTFTIECHISPHLLDQVRRRMDCDMLRFYSDTFDDKEQKINFNKSAIRPIRIVCDEIDDSNIEDFNLLLTIWWREFGSKHSKCLGTAKFRFSSLFNASALEQKKRLSVISCINQMHVADLVCKVSLGTKAVSFEEDVCSYSRKYSVAERDSDSSEILSLSHRTSCCQRNHQPVDGVDKDTNQTQKSTTTRSSQTQTTTSVPNSGASSAQESQNSSSDGLKTDKLSTESEKEHVTLLKGLLYISKLKDVKPVENGQYFIVCRGFWKDDATSTDYPVGDDFNFLEIFPVLKDQKFLDRVQQNHLLLELWQKSVGATEQMVGVCRLPLHQFFIAFRDEAVTNHLGKSKLPVISIDGFASILSPLSNELCGQLQSLLAIGTEDQIEYLKTIRGFNDNSVYRSSIPNRTIPVPKLPIPTCPTNPSEDRLKGLLGSFLEKFSVPPVSQPLEVTSSNGENSTETNKNMRKTSDLLDVLQKALAVPSPAAAPTNLNFLPPPPPPNPKVFKISVTVENAVQLPRNPQLKTKKGSKRVAGGKGKQNRYPPNEEPSAYVTFQAEEGYGAMVKSHEGMVYATNVIEKSSNPSWSKQFDVALPTDYLTNEQKRFILKIWKKASTDLAHCRLLPTPMEDSIIGFSAIDLTVLLRRTPNIIGWFNIVDFSGRVNGQIKVVIRPLEDVMKFKPKTSKPIGLTFLAKKTVQPPSAAVGSDSNIDLNNTTLSRALKRKFTELEEISQRLRARLLDVTGEADPDMDLAEVDDAQLDEFERDLNTACDEDSEKNARNNFDWLKKIMPSDFDFVTSPPESSISGTSGEKDLDNNAEASENIRLISDFLQRNDLGEEIAKDDNPQKRNSPDGRTATESQCSKQD